MDILDLPTRFPAAWAYGASSPYIVPIPTGAGGLDPGRASLQLGFPPLTFTSITAGGIPPFGSDTNGILNQITAGLQWLQAGGPCVWDSAFSTAIGGYPVGAVVQSANSPGHFWQNLVDNNTTNPDTGGANWKPWPSGGFYTVDTGTANAGTITLSLPITGIDQLLGVPIVVEKSGAANTTGYTMTINGTGGPIGPINVRNSNGSTLLPNQLQAGGIFVLLWNGVYFTLLGGTPSLSAAVAGGTSTTMVGILPPGNAPVQILAIFPTPGVNTFTVPSDRYSLYGICTGAGGGGAGENTGGPFTGGGGGAGGTAMGWFDVIPTSEITIITGLGGIGGTVSGSGSAQGLNGGSSSIGAFLTAAGGTAGQSGATAAGGDGGAGVSAGAGIGLQGGYGGDGDITMTGAFAGNGGASYWGGGLRASRVGPVATPAAFGSGGGGGYIGGNGSPGMPGICVIIG